MRGQLVIPDHSIYGAYTDIETVGGFGNAVVLSGLRRGGYSGGAGGWILTILNYRLSLISCNGFVGFQNRFDYFYGAGFHGVFRPFMMITIALPDTRMS